MSQLQDFLTNLNASGESVTPLMMVLALLASFVAAQVVAWTYIWSHSGVSYSRAYVQSLVLIAVVVSMVMIIVGTNVIVAFGLFGAFAVIRFRNVLKDTRDTAFIFMELAVGLAAGTWNFSALIVGLSFFVVVTLYLSYTNFGALEITDALVNLRANRSQVERVEDIIYRHCQRRRLISRHTGGDSDISDWSWRVLLRNPDHVDDFIAELKGIDGVGEVSLLFQGDSMEA